ncbi:kinesin-like protein KIN-7K, chloroplastic [Salvia hispanica]|uniref:kinesin-like protein KIN-7K, chloroplastic n=1 Tax=Salvia hispanica TaxID=49212 RepID=UPI00200922E8|nr:kinesin-like protein KIN-7K, chloroplastic [Salvia hispanica]XP_047960209.1 kinesin-like protein KIN-7K, chloroplastic [Salvia hispanica]XP_047960210.1 kinesin-like protein KIN-7K, chloroplastic [Salvia hispanica]
MAYRQGLTLKKPSQRATANNNSSASSTTSSSRQFPEPSIDCLSSPASSSARSKPQYTYSESVLDVERSKENVTVTVRFRPLSPREIRQGEEIAWYADGETIVRNEHNPSIAYAYDRVFGPTTTTRHVYDVAAQHVVNGAMEGINGTMFAYGVTSSGKTHTMHGDQRSPGIIPLAVKDAFSIIQETPTREFLLRVSYLEIYNEVVNDLLNPAGQNLRIREDAQGTFVEGVKDEVILSPAHALSLIAAGEEHRHVGSTNFNLQSSRSHTIFTLTIESSPCGEYSEGEAVTLSQLNLIDLAGSESSKAETTGLRRKEGSYINKSLLTLGTVISKLTDGKSMHVPYRDSKLTRLLQSSLSGQGRVSLICNITPSSSNSEETHNTLKFAHRAKHIEIQAAQNKIIDEKSLIKKYQYEIRCLKEELEQLKRGIITVPQIKDSAEGDIMLLKQKLEDGQVRLQSRLEQEEEAKAALMSRIQRLTKLILVSTKTSQSPKFSQRSGPRRRHSFGEEELAYLPHRRRDLVLDDESVDTYVPLDSSAETVDEKLREEKRTKKTGLLSWLKPRKRDSGIGALASSSDKSSGVKSTSSPSTPQADSTNSHMEARHSHSLPSDNTPVDQISDMKHTEEVFEPDDTYLGQETSLGIVKTMDEIDLLSEQQKILSGEVGLHMSALKRLSEEAAQNPKNEHLHAEIRNLKEEFHQKSNQIASLQQQIDSVIPYAGQDKLEESLSVADVVTQLNEKALELEVKTADNRVIQDQLNHKIAECEELKETIVSLREQLSDVVEQRNLIPLTGPLQGFSESGNLHMGYQIGRENSVPRDSNGTLVLQAQASRIEELENKLAELTASREDLEQRNQKLAEESSYAKGLASAAAVELKALSEEVAKLMNHNGRLAAELEAQKKVPAQRRTAIPNRNGRKDGFSKKPDPAVLALEMKKELTVSREREHSLEAVLAEKDQHEVELQRKVEESKQREAYLENELANMWILVAKLKKSQGAENDESSRESLKIDDS